MEGFQRFLKFSHFLFLSVNDITQKMRESELWWALTRPSKKQTFLAEEIRSQWKTRVGGFYRVLGLGAFRLGEWGRTKKWQLQLPEGRLRSVRCSERQPQIQSQRRWDSHHHLSLRFVQLSGLFALGSLPLLLWGTPPLCVHFPIWVLKKFACLRIMIGFGRLVRRELSSLRPVHSAIASACLVSKLPADATICTEGLPP